MAPPGGLTGSDILYIGSAKEIGTNAHFAVLQYLAKQRGGGGVTYLSSHKPMLLNFFFGGA